MVTIKEIAKAVGVSATTVSRVLNYDPTLTMSPAKRQAIIETAEALNYETPRNRSKAGGSADAGQLARLMIVHFLDPSEEIADPYYVGVRLGIENRCRELNAEMTKAFHPDGIPDAQQLAASAGVIVIGKHSARDIAWLRAYARHVVFADFDPHDDTVDSVFSDMGFATLKILNFLKAGGYRRIGFIGSSDYIDGETRQFGEWRCAAYIDWQKANGGFDPDLILLADSGAGQSHRLEDGYRLAHQMLSLPVPPDAIVTSNDNMAIGAYRAIQERGLRIPDDLGVVSFNDIPVAQFLTPPLTTIRIHAEHIGETAVDLLFERLSGRAFGRQVRIATELMIRSSCREPELPA